MAGKRRSFSGGFKATAQLAAEYEVHAGQITSWKKQLLAGAAQLFDDGRRKRATDEAANEEKLYEQIGRLKMVFEWLKTSCPVRVVGTRAKHVVQPTRRRIGREPGALAADRRAVPPAAVLRQSQNGRSAGDQSQACATADVPDGDRSDLSQAADHLAWHWAQDLPICIAECGGHAARPGVG